MKKVRNIESSAHWVYNDNCTQAQSRVFLTRLCSLIKHGQWRIEARRRKEEKNDFFYFTANDCVVLFSLIFAGWSRSSTGQRPAWHVHVRGGSLHGILESCRNIIRGSYGANWWSRRNLSSSLKRHGTRPEKVLSRKCGLLFIERASVLRKAEDFKNLARQHWRWSVLVPS